MGEPLRKVDIVPGTLVTWGRPGDTWPGCDVGFISRAHGERFWVFWVLDPDRPGDDPWNFSDLHMDSWALLVSGKDCA